jgi:ribosome-associated protein
MCRILSLALLVVMMCMTPSQAWTTLPQSMAQRTTTTTQTTTATSTTLWDKKTNKYLVDFINQPMGSMVGDEPSHQVPPERDELADLVRCVVRAADGRKADNVVAMRVSKVSTMTSFVVIVSGNSRPQNQAIAAAVKADVSEQYDMLPGSSGVPEGDAQSGWIVLDYGSIMCHIMTPKSRLYYNVEGQWKDKGGEYMDLSDVLIPNSMENSAGAMEGMSKDEDPFWS